MSHSKERHEKICLNCNAELTGRYCHICGQENIEPKETVWGLVSHFFYDITHFDGKFFSTTKYLITKPGFLPQEYIKGRRASYLHPIRMYVFSSALFFLIFFTMFKPDNIAKGNWGSKKNFIDSAAQLDIARDLALAGMRSKEDSLEMINTFAEAKAKVIADRAKEKARKDSLKKVRATRQPDKRTTWFEASDEYETVQQYDSVQQALKPELRDGWWARKAARRNIELSNRWREDNKKFVREMIDTFLHMLPYLLFLSLPLYALLMKLLYFRHKQFYYVEHGIFFIYLYIFTFIFLLLYFSVIELRQATDQGWIGWIEAALIIGGIYYTYKAMRKFYKQGRAMTLLKFFLLNLMATFAMVMLFIFFFTLTLFKL